MRAGDFGTVSTSVATRDDGARIADALLAEKLAACVQLMPVESRYVWKGVATAAPEFLLLIKTRSALFDKVMARIRALHPYETPEIVALTFSAGLPDYLAWIAESTQPD